MTEWPEAIRPSTLKWRLESNGISFTSPFSGQTQTVTFPGSSWQVTMSFDMLDEWEVRELEAFIVSMDGIGGRCLLWDMGRAGRPALGKPVVRGINSGNVLATFGWTPNRKVLFKGDYISVNNEMKLVLADVWSGLDSSALINVGPMWRNTPADGSPVETQNPRGIFRLSDNNQGPDRRPAFDNDVTLKFVEAV